MSTFWNEGFEYANQAAFEAVWAVSNVNNSACSPSTEFAITGTKSLKMATVNDGGGGFIDRPFTPSTEVWVKFNYRTANFTYAT